LKNVWVQTGVGDVGSSFILKAGQAYYIKLQAATDGKVWNRQSPLK